MRLLGILLLMASGCFAADEDCGLIRAGTPMGAPGAAECAKLIVFDDDRITKGDANGCTAEGSMCVVLMPGESAVAWRPELTAGGVRASRETTLLTAHGGCPLWCE